MNRPWDDDSEALFACAGYGRALCTVTEIDGSWSRRLGAQLAVLPDGSTRGSLSDGCLVAAPAGEPADVPLSLGAAPDLPVDPWTAIAVLFHDHEWERSLLPWALGTPAF